MGEEGRGRELEGRGFEGERGGEDSYRGAGRSPIIVPPAQNHLLLEAGEGFPRDRGEGEKVITNRGQAALRW